MKHLWRSTLMLVLAVFYQWVFFRTGIVWFALAAAGAAVLSMVYYLRFSRTL